MQWLAVPLAFAASGSTGKVAKTQGSRAASGAATGMPAGSTIAGALPPHMVSEHARPPGL